MAKKTSNTLTLRAYLTKSKKKRAGVHAKSKTSKNKNSKNYKKPNASQGR